MGKRNPQVIGEVYRLQQNAPRLLAAGMTGPAILAAWFLFGDDMWADTKEKGIAQTELCPDTNSDRVVSQEP
jgi:hypothetical protein